MRSTVIERLTCRREVPYDENDHSILLRDGGVHYNAELIQDGLLKIRIKFTYKLKAKDDGKIWGTIEGEALTTIRDASIKASPDGKTAETSDNIGMVVQGAIADDVFLPVSQVAHAMRLPALLLLPQPEPMHDEEPEQAEAKPAARP
ncbi:MAG: hypothetical protein AABX89_03805 [Candidatus Thermoplasmatota archaeon]